MKYKNILINLIYPLAVTAAILLLWAIAAKAIGSEFIMPSVLSTIKRLFALFGSGRFWRAFLGTFLKSLLSFVFSFIFALVFAVAANISLHAKKILSPVMAIVRALPTMAIILLLVIWTNALIAPMVVAVIVVLPTLYTQFYSEISGIDRRLIDMSRVYRVPKKRMLLKLYIPSVLPAVVLAAGAAFSLNLKLMVAAEVLAQTVNSIGGMMQTAKVYFETAELMALTIVTVITGVAFEALSKLYVPKWRKSS